MVGHPATGKLFWVDVKGMAGRSGGWFVREKKALNDLFYILVSVGKDRVSDTFFVLSQDEANSLVQKHIVTHPSGSAMGVGISWLTAQPFKDRWDALPR
jgi:hypothetical protein